MDFETAAKLSGARFVVLKSGLARMERALGQFLLDVHTSEHGYTEVKPPLLVRDEAMFGTAQLPKFEDDQFSRGRYDRLRCWLRRAQFARHPKVRSRMAGSIRRADQRTTDERQSKEALAHPHRRSAADQSRPRIHRRRSRASDAAHRLHAVLPRRSGCGGQRHARHDPPAPVQQGRAGLDHDAGAIEGRA